MHNIEELKEFSKVDIKEVNRENIPNYNELISEIEKRKTDKMEVLLERTDNPYIYEDMGYIVKSVFSSTSSLSYVDCTKQLVAKRAGIV